MQKEINPDKRRDFFVLRFQEGESFWFDLQRITNYIHHMKIGVILFLVLGSYACAQSIDVHVQNTTTDISGATYNVTYQSDQEVQLQLILVNNTGTDQNWDLERVLPATPHWLNNTLSWAPYSDPVGGNDFVIDQNATNWITSIDLQVPQNDSAWLALRYQPLTEGCDFYRYYVLHNDVRVDSFNIEICKTLGIDDLEGLKMELYPNPSNGAVMLQTSQPIANVRVYDLSGREVVSNPTIHSSTTWELFLKEEAATYWVEIELQNGRFIRERVLIV